MISFMTPWIFIGEFLFSIFLIYVPNKVFWSSIKPPYSCGSNNYPHQNLNFGQIKPKHNVHFCKFHFNLYKVRFKGFSLHGFVSVRSCCTRGKVKGNTLSKSLHLKLIIIIIFFYTTKCKLIYKAYQTALFVDRIRPIVSLLPSALTWNKQTKRMYF